MYTDDLNTGLNPWGIYEVDGGHFPNPGYRALGQRFARKACKLIDPDIKLDDHVFDAAFLDTADDVKSHAAISKTVTGTQPDAEHGKLDALTDGKYGSADPEDDAWVVFAGSQKTVELVVDLGEAQTVTAIAVDLLINSKANAAFPVKAIYATSEDGEQYTPLRMRGGAIKFFYKPRQRVELSQTLKPQSLLVLAELDRSDVRFVKITIETDSSRLFLDEIMVNPVAK